GIEEQHRVHAGLKVRRRWQFLISTDGFEHNRLADLASLDSPRSVSVSRIVAAHVTDLEANTGFRYGRQRRISIGEFHRQWLFAEDVLAASRRGLNIARMKLAG